MGCHSVARWAGEMVEPLVAPLAYLKAAESAVSLENSKAGPTAVSRVARSAARLGCCSAGCWAASMVELSAVPSVYLSVVLTVESLETQKVAQKAV